MDKTEFAVIAAALQTYYPRYELLPNGQAMDLWFRELQDLPAELLTAALRKWVNTERFPPSIAELRALSAEIKNGEAPDWGDGWKAVQQAISRYGIYREQDALEALPPLARMAVERLGWRSICESENAETLRAQFRQVYQICQKRETEDRQLPPSLKTTLSMIGGSMPPQLKGE